MVQINLYSLRQVKESGARYNLDSKVIRAPHNAHEIVETVLNLSERSEEVFGILSLNTKNMVVGVHVISTGTLNASLAHPREIFKAALMNNAASIILFHNHPSGDTTPSPEDITLTKRMVEAGTIMGIDVLDHIVVGNHYTSLKERGDV